MTELWQEIARRYQQESYLMGYDLLNEPAMADWTVLNEYYRNTIQAVREVDENHIIVLEGDQFSMDFSGMESFSDVQIALGFHYYPTVWHPELMEYGLERDIRKKKIADGLEKLLATADHLVYPVLCGEFGYAAADCGSLKLAYELLEDTLEIFREHQLNWALWCYKDADFMGLLSPEKTSKWIALASEIDMQWNQDIEKQQAAKLLMLLQKEDFPGLTDRERYLLQFRLRACIYTLQKKHILIPELKKIQERDLPVLAESFLYQNCRVYEKQKEIVKKYM